MLVVALPSCVPPPSSARSLGYEALHVTARGVRVGYQACVKAALVCSELALERRCAAAYGRARIGLLHVEAALDESAGEEQIGCAAGDVLAGAVELSAALGGAGLAVPAALSDGAIAAQRLAAFAGGACPAYDAGMVGSMTKEAPKEMEMHYRNGREARSGDRIVQLTMDGAKIVGVGILYDAVAGNDYCNGQVAAIGTPGACLVDCIHADDLAVLLTANGLDKRPK